MVDKKEQEMKQEISSFMRRKDFYQILGVTKAASDVEIKKAYRTLALRFHPDKNQVQGSKEVFKKVSTSYSTLIDPEKRRRYDQFGNEQDRPRPQHHRHHHQHGQDEEFYEFDDIFQAFFGGAPRQQRGGQRPFRGFQFNNVNRAQQQQQNQQGTTGFNIYYVFIIFFLIYTILPLFQSSPNYSLAPTYEHRIRRTTSKLNVEYHVNSKFMQEARSVEYLRRAEMEMDKEYLTGLEQKCQYLKNQKRNLETYAYQYSEGRQRQNYLKRAKNVDMGPCRYLQQVSNTFEDYVRELTYMRV